MADLIEHHSQHHRDGSAEHRVKKVEDDRVLGGSPRLGKVGEKELKVFEADPGASKDPVFIIVIFEDDDEAAHGDIGKHQCERYTRQSEQPELIIFLEMTGNAAEGAGIPARILFLSRCGHHGNSSLHFCVT